MSPDYYLGALQICFGQGAKKHRLASRVHRSNKCGNMEREIYTGCPDHKRYLGSPPRSGGQFQPLSPSVCAGRRSRPLKIPLYYVVLSLFFFLAKILPRKSGILRSTMTLVTDHSIQTPEALISSKLGRMLEGTVEMLLSSAASCEYIEFFMPFSIISGVLRWDKSFLRQIIPSDSNPIILFTTWKWRESIKVSIANYIRAFRYCT